MAVIGAVIIAGSVVVHINAFDVMNIANGGRLGDGTNHFVVNKSGAGAQMLLFSGIIPILCLDSFPPVDVVG